MPMFLGVSIPLQAPVLPTYVRMTPESDSALCTLLTFSPGQAAVNHELKSTLGRPFILEFMMDLCPRGKTETTKQRNNSLEDGRLRDLDEHLRMSHTDIVFCISLTYEDLPVPE